MGVQVEFQRALYDALNGAKATLGVVGVYDIAPQKADAGDASSYPIIVMGRVISANADTQTTIGHDMTARIHTWSATGSMAECKTIQDGIFDLLHRSTLTVTGGSNFLLLRNDTDCLFDEGRAVHGVCEYRALVEAA